MSIRELIENPAADLTKVLDYEGKTYVFKGRPDANLIADSLLLPPPKVEQYSQLFTITCGTPVKATLIKHIFAVHSTLQPDEGEDKYDVSEIAKLACTTGALFLSMIPCAYEVLGLSSSEPTPFELVASGNSEEPAATS